MPLSSGLSIHDDTKHKGSAKRDSVSGVAALDGSGNVLGVANALYLKRDVAGYIHIYERESDEPVIFWKRFGADDYKGYIRVAASNKELQHVGLKDIANGIAGLDASALLPVALLPGIGERYIISNDLLHSHDTGAYSTTTSYVKVKTITVNNMHPTPSTIRIKFDLACDATAYGRIYKNGVAVGTERSKAGSPWETFTEDLSFAESDTIELWTKNNDGVSYAHSRNFRIYGIVHSQTLAEAINESEAGGADAWNASNS